MRCKKKKSQIQIHLHQSLENIYNDEENFSFFLSILFLYCIPILIPFFMFTFILTSCQLNGQNHKAFSYGGSKKTPLEKTHSNYKQTIILTGPSQMTTFTTSTAETHSSKRQNIDNKPFSEMSFRPSIAGCAENPLKTTGEKTKTYLSSSVSHRLTVLPWQEPHGLYSISLDYFSFQPFSST